jgi:hypothetical protein
VSTALAKTLQGGAGLLLLLACAAVFRAVAALDMQCETATAEETSPGEKRGQRLLGEGKAAACGTFGKQHGR